MPEPQVLVTLGVDTHADTHVAAALDQLGRHLATITVAIVRMSHDEKTKKYIARRNSEGKTKRETIRCLKRYIARDLYRILVPIITTKPGT
jgi:hypothetical protein